MSTETPLPGLLTPEAALHRLADRLVERFAGVFARETIDRYVFESYTALARTAKVTTHLPVLTERFATERLTALAQAKGAIERDGCEVLFVCVHNAGRSQMAAGWLRHLAGDAVEASHVVITMGCGDVCPIFPGKRYEDWKLEDPAGKGVEAVRPIRDEIEGRIRGLVAELVPAQAATPTKAPTSPERS